MFTVRDLCEVLNSHDPDTEVGICMSDMSGWVQGIRRILIDEKGRVLLDQTEETLDTEEVEIRKIGK